jgi:hypothetical protein
MEGAIMMRVFLFVTIFGLPLALAGVAEAESVTLFQGYTLTEQSYHYQADWSSAVEDEFGSEAEVADWSDIKADFGSTNTEAKDFADEVLDGGSGFVYRNGDRKYSSNRAYFASAHYGSKPSHYLAHDDIQNHMVSLGSWHTTKPIVATGLTPSMVNPVPSPAAWIGGGLLLAVGAVSRSRVMRRK